MAALWDVATAEERREMVILLLEPGGLYCDLELNNRHTQTQATIFTNLTHAERGGRVRRSQWNTCHRTLATLVPNFLTRRIIYDTFSL
jgi:hypothetical protein